MRKYATISKPVSHLSSEHSHALTTLPPEVDFDRMNFAAEFLYLKVKNPICEKKTRFTSL